VVEDIELRQTKTTRLIFRPLLVDNAHDREAAVKGTFLFQRKRPGQDWEDYRTFNLSELKAEEGVKLALKSAEVLTLFRELEALYGLYEEEGIPSGEVGYYRGSPVLDLLSKVSDAEFETIVQAQEGQASETLVRLLRWALASSNTDEMLTSLEQLDVDILGELTNLAGLRTLRSCLEIWEDNQTNSDEEFWQETLGEYAFVLSQVFAHPVVILKDKAFVGGKSVINVGGNLLDFLLQNAVTRNVILVEIKTPMTALLGSRYRGNVYSPSSDIAGALLQVANYKQSLMTHYFSLREPQDLEFSAIDPACMLIAGNYTAQIEDDNQRRSFELLRSQQRNVQLVTYDELFGKVKLLIDLLEGNEMTSVSTGEESHLDDAAPDEEDDIPF
jgi:hypothetical protein